MPDTLFRLNSFVHSKLNIQHFIILFFIFVFFWLRATFPRYRYDQIMRLGWKIFIPVTLIWIAVEGVMVYLQVGPWSNLTG